MTEDLPAALPVLTARALLNLEGGRGVWFRPQLVELAGSVKAALFLSQALFWQRHFGLGRWWWKRREGTPSVRHPACEIPEEWK